MGQVVLVDVNGQQPGNAVALGHFLETSEVERVVLSGAHGALGAWEERLERHFTDTDRIEVLYGRGRRDEATVMLSCHATRLAQSALAPGHDWLVFSQREGFAALAESLLELGAASARWAPAPTADFLRALLHGEADYGQMIHRVAEQMMEKAGSKPILVGTLANAIAELAPALSSAEHREELFGSRRFKAICKTVGLKVRGDHVHPIKRQP